MGPFFEETANEPGGGLKLRRRHEQNRAIRQVMAAQGGVICGRQLVGFGLSRAAIRRRVAARDLFRVFHDVYAESAGGPIGRGLDWAALLSAGPGAALSSVTAAAVLDLTARRPRDGLHVVQVDDGRRAPSAVTRHRTKWLPSTDLVVVDGLRCTAPARTLLDSAAHPLIDDDRLDDLLDRAVELRLYDGAALERVLAERPGVRGSRRLTDAIARLDETAGITRSRFERKLRDLVRESQLITMPAFNAMVGGYESDSWWVGTRAMIECDGREVHRSPAQLARDDERERAYVAAGYAILRLTWRQVVYEPARTLARIEAFVLANQAPPTPGVTGLVAF